MLENSQSVWVIAGLVLQQETLRKTDWTSWREFVLKTVSMSPVMQETLAERRDFYSRALTDLIDGERQGLQ